MYCSISTRIASHRRHLHVKPKRKQRCVGMCGRDGKHKYKEEARDKGRDTVEDEQKPVITASVALLP